MRCFSCKQKAIESGGFLFAVHSNVKFSLRHWFDFRHVVTYASKFCSMNWTVIIIVGILLFALLVFIIRKNQKDEREFEQQLNNDYHKTKDEEGDVETDKSLR